MPGDYLVQVKTNGLGTDNTNQGNRFALRSFSTSDTNAKNLVSVSGRERMSIFSNAPSATTEFYLARIQSATAGQILQIKLFDVGDSTQAGTIQLDRTTGLRLDVHELYGRGWQHRAQPAHVLVHGHQRHSPGQARHHPDPDSRQLHLPGH